MEIKLMAWILKNRLWLFIVVCAILLIIGIYNKGSRDSKMACEVAKAHELIKLQEQKDLDIDKANKKSAELEISLANQKSINKKLNLKVQDEIRKNTAYSTCIITDNGMQLFNESIRKSTSSR